MRSPLPLSLALIFTLTACSGQAATSPAENAAPLAVAATQVTSIPAATLFPATPMALEAIPLSGDVLEPVASELDPELFPTRLVTEGAELERLMAETDVKMALVAQLPELNAHLYSYWGETYDDECLVLQVGDAWAAYPLHWCSTRGYLPQLHSGDLDGDGDTELALLAYTGSGTGVSSWTLCVVELEAGLPACVLPDLTYESDLAPYLGCSFNKGTQQATITLGSDEVDVDLSQYDLTDDSPLEPYAGTIVDYAVEGNTITATLAVGLYGKGLPYTVWYFCDLRAQVAYDGTTFALRDPHLVP